jgi:hypothetical protein
VGRVRLLPLAAVVLVAACAVTGCTTVSPAPPAPSRPSGPAPQRAPDVLAPTPPPVDPLLATARADPRVPPSAAASPRRQAGLPQRRAAAVPAAPSRQRPAVDPRVPVSGGTCALGRAYGHWAAGSSAAKICEGVYGR